MIVLLNDNQFKKDNIILLDKNTNTIMNNGYFHRIYYSNTKFTMNGIFILYDLENVIVQEDFNKIMISIQYESYNEIMSSIKKIETEISTKYFPYIKKNFVSKMNDYFVNNKIRIFNDNNIRSGNYKIKSLILKISGIWETQSQYGVTFKILLV